MRKFPLILFAVITLASCTVTPSEPWDDGEDDEEELQVYNMNLNGVYDNNEANNTIKFVNAYEKETFTYTFTGDNIRIEDGKVISLRGNTKTTVSVKSSHNRTATFTVNVKNRAYTSTHQAAETSEGWFNEVSINKIDSMTASFANGMDISSCKQLYDNGQKFYDKDGNEVALTYLLRDNGVNWIRLRLWVEPWDTLEDGSKYLYGGGNCDNDHIVWIAKEAKAAGLKVLLNFHYSDFWTDPSHQIIPKAWKDISSSSALATKVYQYTKETLLLFKKNNALPDAVALGNEISTGLFAHNPGGITTSPIGTSAYYHSGKTERTDGTQGKYDNTGNPDTLVNSNLLKYVKAGVDAVKEVNSNILTMVHYVKGLSDPNSSIKFFQMFVTKNINIDIFGLSAYSYYHYSNISTLRNGLTTIANAFPTKKIAIVETSYGFTYEEDNWAKNTFQSTGTVSPVSNYPCSTQGQASILRDTTEVVSDLSNGWGVFYWEGAWTPTKYSGWADIASKVSWANQGFFSYNGKMLGSLEVYNKMLGK